jgi:hypothetical protein
MLNRLAQIRPSFPSMKPRSSRPGGCQDRSSNRPAEIDPTVRRGGSSVTTEYDERELSGPRLD